MYFLARIALSATATFLLLALSPAAHAEGLTGGPASAAPKVVITEVGPIADGATGKAAMHEVGSCTDADCFENPLKAHAGSAQRFLERGYTLLDKDIRGNLLAACKNELNPRRTQCVVNILQTFLVGAELVQKNCAGNAPADGPAATNYTDALEGKLMAESNLTKMLRYLCKGATDKEACYREKTEVVRNQAQRAIVPLQSAVHDLVYYGIQSLLCDSGEDAVMKQFKDAEKRKKKTAAAAVAKAGAPAPTPEPSPEPSRFPGWGRYRCKTEELAKPFTEFNPMAPEYVPTKDAEVAADTCTIVKKELDIQKTLDETQKTEAAGGMVFEADVVKGKAPSPEDDNLPPGGKIIRRPVPQPEIKAE